MLQSLHVKNLALIAETEVEFGPGLNIMTGETGAGKSVLIGSINLALGGRFDKDMLRKGSEYCLVELTFAVGEDRNVREKMEDLDISWENGTILISRKLWPGRSVCRINGETVSARQVKELSELLIDIHGQHEHQSLLQKRKHLEILDAYCGEALRLPAAEAAGLFRECGKLRAQIEEEAMDEASRAREQAMCEFELAEIENARLHPHEDEELEQLYRKMSNSLKITESLAEGLRYTGNDDAEGAGEAIRHALRAIRGVSMYDEKLGSLETQLEEIDSLLSDFHRDLEAYLADCEFDEEDFKGTQERLDEINRLKGKYGKTIEAILAYGTSRAERLQQLKDYESYMAELKKQLSGKEKALQELCRQMSQIRQENARLLSGKLKEALVNLNFLTVEFEIAVRSDSTLTSSGWDDVEFLISTNPGEPLRPLAQVASGGELSRVMLAIKTVLAERDAIDTLIFDEIDAGISGRTAFKVAGQLDRAARVHQVICITHLPQIAAMADTHFVIEKSAAGDTTLTDIHLAGEEESLRELARLLGSDTITEAALKNAAELRSQALTRKRE